jgi:hypothetical protein
LVGSAGGGIQKDVGATRCSRWRRRRRRRRRRRSKQCSAGSQIEMGGGGGADVLAAC